jgi:hypothetical protein
VVNAEQIFALFPAGVISVEGIGLALQEPHATS